MAFLLSLFAVDTLSRTEYIYGVLVALLFQVSLFWLVRLSCQGRYKDHPKKDYILSLFYMLPVHVILAFSSFTLNFFSCSEGLVINNFECANHRTALSIFIICLAASYYSFDIILLFTTYKDDSRKWQYFGHHFITSTGYLIILSA